MATSPALWRLAPSTVTCRWCSTTASPEVVAVSQWGDVQPYLRRFMRRVHPDVVFNQSEQAVDDNTTSLRNVNELVEGVRERCDVLHPRGSGSGAAPPPRGGLALPPLAASYPLRFHWLPPAGGGARVFDVTVDVPSALVTETDMVAGRSHGRAHARLHRRWLQFGTDVVSRLLAAVDVPVVLAAAAASGAGGAGGDSRGRRHEPRRFDGAARRGGPSPGTLLHHNLVQASPLRQGKVHDHPAPSASVTARATVFTHKQRVARVSALVASGRLAADAAVPSDRRSAALLRLTALLVHQFERLQLYDPVWDSMLVRVGWVYHWSPATRTMLVPHTFTAAEFAAFVDAVLPEVSLAASTDALRAARRRARRQR